MHNSLQSFAVLIGDVSIPHWDALSQLTFYGPWIESFQDSWWDTEFPQLSQMVKSLPGFLNLCLNVCSPSQVLWEVYTKVLEAAHPLHMVPTDHKRSVGSLLSLTEIHNQLFSFAHIQRETVVLAPWCKSLYLIQVCGLIIVEMDPEPQPLSANLTIEVELWEDTQSYVYRVEQGTRDTALWGCYVQGDGVWGELAYFHHLRSAGEKMIPMIWLPTFFKIYFVLHSRK